MNDHQPTPLPARDTVALVDDDEQICLALQEWLGLLDVASRYYLCAEALLEDIDARDGRWWFKTPGADGGPARLAGAVVDLNLPGLQGTELAQELLRVAPTLRIVLITAASDEARQRLADTARGVICLKKPFSIDALEQVLLPL